MRRCLVIFSALLFVAAAPKKTARNWSDVEQAIGRSGSIMPGEVYKVSFPRTDLTVTVGSVTVKPALALGSWAAFKEIGAGEVMTTGDLVLLETEVNPVIDALQRGESIRPPSTIIFSANRRVLYLHFMGRGNPATLAAKPKPALAATKTPMEPPAAPATSQGIDLPAADLDRILMTGDLVMSLRSALDRMHVKK